MLRMQGVYGREIENWIANMWPYKKYNLWILQKLAIDNKDIQF